MALPSPLQVAPLATAVLWLGLALRLVLRDRFRTWTERCLLATCGFVGAYALADFVFFNAASASGAELAVRVALTLQIGVAASFFLFAAVLHGRVRRSLALILLPAAGAVGIVWTRLVAGVSPAPDLGIPYHAVYDLLGFTIWLAVALGFAVPGVAILTRTLTEVGRTAPALGRRMRLELAAVVGAVAVGVGINLLETVGNLSLPPLLSTLLAIPGVAAFAALSPKAEPPFLEAAHRWKSPEYRIRAAFLTYSDGTLIGTQVPPGELAVESDLFSSTLDVIQNFMRTSFPMLEGKWLKSITHGDLTLVLERGAATCLVLAVQGKESDQLRRLMREALRDFEKTNRQALARWRGVAADAVGTKEMLSALLQA